MSFNHDIEGHTTDKSVLAAREEHKAWLMRQLMTSKGHKLLLAGDDAQVTAKIGIYQTLQSTPSRYTVVPATGADEREIDPSVPKITVAVPALVATTLRTSANGLIPD